MPTRLRPFSRENNRYLSREDKPILPLNELPENQFIMHPRIIGQSARESMTDYANPRDFTIRVAPGDSIQKAVDRLASTSGGIIKLQQGTHIVDKQITVSTDNVRVIGDGIDITILNVLDSYNADDGGVFEVTGNNVLFEGFTLNGPTNPDFIEPYGINFDFDTDSIVIREMKFEGFTETVINGEISGFLSGYFSIIRNLFDTCGGSCIDIINSTIGFATTSGLHQEIIGNRFIDSALVTGARTIRITANASGHTTRGTVIAENLIENSNNHAIQVEGSLENRIISNRIRGGNSTTDDTYTAILVGNSATVNVVHGNIITGSRYLYGILETGSTSNQNIFSNNIVTDGSDDAIQISGANSIEVDNITS